MTVVELPRFAFAIGEREAVTMMVSISSVESPFDWPKTGPQKTIPFTR
jgi:hypothetical protein